MARLKTEESNYKKFNELAPEILSGENMYMKLKSEGFMDLIIERIDKNEISMAHYFEQNGDLMCDPEITFKFDNDKKTLEPQTYRLDSLGVYQQVYVGEMYSPKLRKELLNFTNEWLNNIKCQGHTLAKAIENDGTFSKYKENSIEENQELQNQETPENGMNLNM